ncbi:conserved membrane hypothetical protein [Rubrivivax sp. A210]|uniref:lipopolysaccharide biosynthesis protein n=1 Tax=Rubrivivax sp. A210 TaxID=2772301 RepID=UPI0019185204|nr:lipopolysaccharide biosynthesis protein [Rubrivivax sp. A210]CAD5375225.1 conserved membrane hypothetical protein [Rubrivivax sp. A210]
MGTRRALFFSFLDRYSALALSILSSMVIARLLTPADIGVFSVTMVLVAFANSLRDLGAGQYLVQERDLNATRIRAVWTVLLGTGLLMAVIVSVAAYPVSKFYREPRMALIMGVVAVNFVVNPFGSMTYAWLIREMSFQRLAVMRFFSSLAGAVASVILAWQDFGPLSLALGNLAATCVNAAIGAWFRPAHFSWLPGRHELRRVLKFGGTTSATNIIWDFAIGAPELLLGRLQTLGAAGYYSRANGLTMMFQRLVLDATNAVAMPLFAREHRQGGNTSASFLRATSYVTALGWSFFIGLALMAGPTVRVLYGDQWDFSARITQVLAIGMCIALPAAMCQTLLLALGRVATIMRTTAFLVPVQVACIAVGATSGALQAAVGFAVAQIVAVSAWLLVTRSAIGFEFQGLLRVLARSAALALLVAIVPAASLAASTYWKPLGNLAQVSLVFALSLPVFVGAVRLLGHPFAAEVNLALAKVFGPKG